MTRPRPSGTGLNDLLVVWDEACLRHDPGGEVWLGQRDTGTEVAALRLAGGAETV